MELSTETVVNVLRKEYDPWINSLTDQEKHAIEKYAWNSFDRIHKKMPFFSRLNAMLRGISTDESSMLNEYAETISNAIRKHPLQHEVVCYRGCNHDMTNNAVVGQVVISRQFISTSVVRSRIIEGQYEYIIHVPKGASAAYIEKLSVYKKQRELLIDRETAYRVISRNGTLIELEVQL